MTSKSVYQLSARQILLLAFATALVAVGATTLLYTLNNIWQNKDRSAVTFAEGEAPQGVSDPSAVSDEQNSIEVYRSISPGVAFINTTSYRQDSWGSVQEGKGNGSGSVIDSNGHILTNFHVVEGSQNKLTVSFGGDKTYPAEFIGGDPDTDLAVIKIQPPAGGLTVVPLGDSDRLSVGQKVLAIGNPFGLDRTLTTGVISGLQRPIRARNDRPIDAAIQTDASINPGNSGGPLLDKFGRMIGINSQILSPAGGSVGVGFAVPVNTAKRVIPQLLQFGSVRRPKMGIDGVGIEKLVQRGIDLPIGKGLLLYTVSSGGPAYAAGLRGISRGADGDLVLGDVITSIDGTAIGDLDDLYRYLDKKQIGDTVQVQVFRDGRNLNMPVRLSGGLTAQPRQPTRRLQ
ncbi:MAG: trypsin-like peptidase domain-containing protein [Acidobacteriota bacterium]|nr:trypsin-like peptidase domain-containing protein [Acidobacteriota bacterium]